MQYSNKEQTKEYCRLTFTSISGVNLADFIFFSSVQKLTAEFTGNRIVCGKMCQNKKTHQRTLLFRAKKFVARSMDSPPCVVGHCYNLSLKRQVTIVFVTSEHPSAQPVPIVGIKFTWGAVIIYRYQGAEESTKAWKHGQA